MNRKVFMRRMAHAAMAGMLGVELLTRMPTMRRSDWEVLDYYDLRGVHLIDPGVAPQSVGEITAIDPENLTITVDWK